MSFNAKYSISKACIYFKLKFDSPSLEMTHRGKSNENYRIYNKDKHGLDIRNLKCIYKNINTPRHEISNQEKHKLIRIDAFADCRNYSTR